MIFFKSYALCGIQFFEIINHLSRVRYVTGVRKPEQMFNVYLWRIKTILTFWVIESAFWRSLKISCLGFLEFGYFSLRCQTDLILSPPTPLFPNTETHLTHLTSWFFRFYNIFVSTLVHPKSCRRSRQIKLCGWNKLRRPWDELRQEKEFIWTVNLKSLSLTLVPSNQR